MMRRFVSLFVLCSLALAVVGCGGEESKDPKTQGPVNPNLKPKEGKGGGPAVKPSPQ